MFNVEDTVLYGSQGVCKVDEIVEKEVCGNSVTYYVLKPVYNEKSTIFVPVNNKNLTDKMKKALTKDEIYSIIQAMPDEETIWVENESLRKEKYKAIITNGDRKELVKLIKTLYLYQKKQVENGKRLHISDDVFLKDAEKLLYDEFALVLNLKRESVLPFIMEQLNTKNA